MNEEWFKHPTNLVDLFEDTVERFPNRKWLGTKNSRGEYDWITYKEAELRVNNLRSSLAEIGVNKDDAVGLIINNSVEWAIIAFATYGPNARLIPMYEKELEKVWRYIIEDSGVKVLFVANDDIYNKVKGYKDEISTLEKIYIIRSKSTYNTMIELELRGSVHQIASVKPHWSDIAGLVYTSGTTGDPKGVLLSHGNFTSNVRAAHTNFPDIHHEDVSFSILPWAHSFGQVAELYCDLFCGAACGLMDTMDTLLEDIANVRPTILIAVPRVFNKVYAGIHGMMKQEGGKIEHLFNTAKHLAEVKRETGKAGVKYKLLNKLVFGKIRSKFGGRLRYAVTGSAVMNPEIAQFFIDIGIPTYDCYGMTETTPAMTMNSPIATKLGTVGRPIENVTVIIDKSLVGEDSEDGEIICFGPNVMQGYHNKPEKTAEVFVDDPIYGKGVRTGDRGRIDEDGFLLITGRFKEEYKLENGKYVHPASIEEDLKLNPYVLNAMVFGDGKKYNVCIVVPDFENLRKFANSKGFSIDSNKDLINENFIQSFLTSEITNQLSGSYGSYEIPKKFLFIAEDFTLENGFATQTMKLKRRNVVKAYGDQLNNLYEINENILINMGKNQTNFATETPSTSYIPEEKPSTSYIPEEKPSNSYILDDTTQVIQQELEKNYQEFLDERITEIKSSDLWNDLNERTVVISNVNKSEKMTKDETIFEIVTGLEERGITVNSIDVMNFIYNFSDKYNRLPLRDEIEPIIKGYISFQGVESVKEETTMFETETIFEEVSTYLSEPEETYVPEPEQTYLPEPEQTYVPEPEQTYVTEPEQTFEQEFEDLPVIQTEYEPQINNNVELVQVVRNDSSKGIMTIPRPVGRRVCPNCENSKIQERVDKEFILYSFPRIYGKKFFCGGCNTEWREE